MTWQSALFIETWLMRTQTTSYLQFALASSSWNSGIRQDPNNQEPSDQTGESTVQIKACSGNLKAKTNFLEKTKPGAYGNQSNQKLWVDRCQMLVSLMQRPTLNHRQHKNAWKTPGYKCSKRLVKVKAHGKHNFNFRSKNAFFAAFTISYMKYRAWLALSCIL